MRSIVATAAVVLALLPGVAAAQPAIGIDVAGTTLLRFDTTAPGTMTPVPVTGLLPGEALVGIDRRPATGALYGVGVIDTGAQDEMRLYRIDPVSGAATRITTTPPPVPTDGNEYGVDFNPTVDRVRVVNDAHENARFNPNNGSLAGDDSNLTDAAVPESRPVKAIAYATNLPFGLGSGATTVFGIGSGASELVTIGGYFQALAGGANGGVVMNAQPLGVAASTNVDLEISETAGTALMSAGANLYNVNLATGVATLIGALGQALHGLTTLPAVTVTMRDREIATSEAAGVASVTVTRSNTSAPTSVRVTTDTSAIVAAGGDTAVAGSDFVAVDTRVHFLTGQSEATVGIPIIGAADGEGAETFTVYLADPGPTTITGGSGTIAPVGLGVDTSLGADRATVTIAADPAPAPVPTPTPTPTPPVDSTGPFAVLVPDASSARRAALAKPGLRVRFVCGEPCGAKLALTLGKTTLASTTAKLTKGGLGSARLKLSRSGASALKTALKRSRSKRLAITAAFTDAAGNVTPASGRITAKR